MPRLSIKELDATDKGAGHDMCLYFNGTFVLVSPEGSPPRWAKYQGYNAAHKEHRFDLASGEKIMIPYGSKNAFVEWHYPTGWFNSGKTSAYCERIPKRQYLKGIYSGNFKAIPAEHIAKEQGFFFDPSGELSNYFTAFGVSNKLNLTAAAVQSMFSTDYPSYEEAYLLMRNKAVFSRALSPDLCMMPHPESKDFIVFCHDYPVAELVTKNKLKVLVSEYKPECAAYFHKQGVSVVS